MSNLKIYTISIKDSAEVSRETEEFNIAAGHFSRLLQKPVSEVKKVEVLEYEPFSPVLMRYNDKRKALAEQREIWVFHGTAATYQIAEQGFKVGDQDGVPAINGTAYGHGVYTATGPTTPMGYSRNSRSVILARGLKGRLGTDHTTPIQDWVIFSSASQLLPCYIVHY